MLTFVESNHTKFSPQNEKAAYMSCDFSRFSVVMLFLEKKNGKNTSFACVV